MSEPLFEIREPGGRLFARWFGDAGHDWSGAASYPDEWELWRDGVRLVRYWRTPIGWESEVF